MVMDIRVDRGQMKQQQKRIMLFLRDSIRSFLNLLSRRIPFTLLGKAMQEFIFRL